MQAEEITSVVQGKQVHINAVNLPGEKAIPAFRGSKDQGVRDAIRKHLRDVAEREKQSGQPILAHLNHPNFHWSITAEDLAHVVEEQFYEVYNGHPSINHLGKPGHPGDEELWDIANAIRLIELKAEPLYGVATDDSHRYHGGNNPPGRGWVMVRAKKLHGDTLVQAMRAGNFYASTGVFLKNVSYDPKKRRMTLEIEPAEGVTFTTSLIGTRKAKSLADTKVGEIFETQTGTRVSFTLPEDALYARARIDSTRAHPRPSYKDQKEQAWVQPVGWK